MSVEVLIAAGSVVVAVILALPLLLGRKPLADRSEYDLRVYRQQLADIEADIARGAVSEEEGASVRLEVERRMLKAARTEPKAATIATPRRIVAVAVIVAVPALSISLYQLQGRPDLPDQPFAERAPSNTPDRARVAELLQKVEQRLKENPQDKRGWRLLGQGYMSLGETGKAVDAFGRAAKLFPDDLDMQSAFGEALVADSNGVVGPEAKRIFQRITSANSTEVAARYYLALADLQAGDAKKAYDKWRDLAVASPPNAPWLNNVQRGLDAAAKELGTDPEKATQLAKGQTASPPPGPSQEQVQAAQQMTPEQREQFIRSMVARLASRLEQSPDDLDGWLRLGQAYTVLGEREKAADAFRKAKGLMKSDDPRLAELDKRIADLAKSRGAAPAEPPGR